jgi:hypothetical protein
LVINSNYSKNKINHQKKIVRDIESVNGLQAMTLINKLKQVPIIGKDFLGLDVLAKMISAIYTEILKQFDRKKNNNPLYFFLYDYLINR